MFKLLSGASKTEYFPKTASTVISVGVLVASVNGQLVPATATTTSHIGISIKPVASTDDDYASATFIPVLIPSQDTIFEADASGLTTALVNTTMDLSNSQYVNGAADSRHAVTLVKYISATKGWFKINSLTAYKNGA